MAALEHRDDIGEDVVTLTFDDGPSPWTDPILEIGDHTFSRPSLPTLDVYWPRTRVTRRFFALGCLAAAD